MGEHLKVDAALLMDGGDLAQGELARQRYAVGAQALAPCGSACVMDVRLGGDVCLDFGHKPLYFREEAPVLNDEGVGAERRAPADELDRLVHLVVFDDDVGGYIDACASKVRGPARAGEFLVGEVLGLASRVHGSHAEVDGIGARRKGRCERFGAACGGEELHTSRKGRCLLSWAIGHGFLSETAKMRACLEMPLRYR